MDASSHIRPQPIADHDSQPFWDALASHRLVVQQCASCGRRRFPPLPTCHHCRSWEFSWVEVTEGLLRSWIVVHHALIDMFIHDVPYVVALVDVGDAAHVAGRLRDADPAGLREGARVVVDLEVVDRQVLPAFALTEPGPS